MEALQALVLGRTIEVRLDGAPNDRYGRLKGHAFLKEDDANGWVQGRLLGMGLARAYTLAGHGWACGPRLPTRLASQRHLGGAAAARGDVSTR